MRTVFYDGNLVVRTNDSGELFISTDVKIKGTAPELRISAGEASGELKVTARDCNWNPTSFNNLGGFSVTHKH